MKTSLLKSLHKSTPKTYMICLHLNLHKQLQIQLDFRGLSAKVHLMDFLKGPVDEKIITMRLLVENYPKIIYDMGNLQKMNQSSRIRKIRGGVICKMTKLQF